MTGVVDLPRRDTPAVPLLIDHTRVRWWPPVAALLFAPLAGMTLAAAGTFVNLLVRDDYFRWGVRARDWDEIVWDAMRPGAGAGLLLGFAYAAGVVAITRTRAHLELVMGCFGYAALVIVASWLLGGAIGWCLGWVRPEMWGFDSPFGYPPNLADLPAYAWVGGSIYGSLIGLVPALVIPLLLLRRRWAEILTVHSPGFAVMHGNDAAPAADAPLAVMSAAPPPIAARAAPLAAPAPATPPARDHSAPPANVV